MTGSPGQPFTIGPRVRTSDGVGIATYDLGGAGPTLLLAHATGFHGLVWLPLADHLRRRFHCQSFDLRGHGRSDKDPSGSLHDWERFRSRHHRRDRRPGCLGRCSISPWAIRAGGAALLLTEEAEPGRFEAVYCRLGAGRSKRPRPGAGGERGRVGAFRPEAPGGVRLPGRRLRQPCAEATLFHLRPGDGAGLRRLRIRGSLRRHDPAALSGRG